MGMLVTFTSGGTPRPIAVDVDMIKAVFTKSGKAFDADEELSGGEEYIPLASKSQMKRLAVMSKGKNNANHNLMILWVVLPGATEYHEITVAHTYEEVMMKIAAAKGMSA